MTGPALTPPQTVGPFFHPALLRADAPGNRLAGPATPGEPIRIVGRVLDGDRAPVPDALVELWQADALGRYCHPADRWPTPSAPAFTGFGRCGTDEAGAFWFETVKPGPVPAPGGGRQAPHLSLTIFARGLLDLLATRLYFDDEPANESDPVLGLVPAERRRTLLTRREPGAAATYRCEIVLQGEGETVFFRLPTAGGAEG